VGLKRGLGVSLTIVARHDDGHFIVSLIIIRVNSSGAIEANKNVFGGATLNLEDNRMICCVVLEVSNTYHGTCPTELGKGIKKLLVTAVPPKLPVLRRIVAHLPHVIRVERVSHLYLLDSVESNM
jgi:hypothetical protein